MEPAGQSKLAHKPALSCQNLQKSRNCVALLRRILDRHLTDGMPLQRNEWPRDPPQSRAVGAACSPHPPNHQYSGRGNDNDTSLIYYRARYYSPRLGRFISGDPLGLGGGMNTYAYDRGDPLSFRDPSGSAPWDGLTGGVTPMEAQTRAAEAAIKSAMSQAMSCVARLPEFINFQLDLYVISFSSTYTKCGDG
jgi:RHS repeat-associated protein